MTPIDLRWPAAADAKPNIHHLCHDGLVAQGKSKMSEKRLGKSEMSSVDFAATALKRYVAPNSEGHNVKDRIRLAARRLGWSFSRTKDVWYADPRVSINADELRAIEEASGVKYGRIEIRTIDELIAKAEALLEGPEADRHRPFVAAFRAFVGALSGADSA